MNWLRGTGRSLLVLLCSLAALPALAQEVAKSPGFKIGDGALHPYLQLDARYDSLVGYFNLDSAGNLVPSGELVLHARPGVRFDLTTPSTSVAFNGNAEYLWFTGLISPGSRALSRLQASVGLDTAFNKDGAVEFQLGDQLTRSDRTQNPALGIGAISLFNNVYLAAPIHPGGRALEVTPKVAWSVEFFERLVNGIANFCPAGTPACEPSQSNYSNLNFGANARWRFLPKTAVIVDVNADWRYYFNDPTNGKVIFRSLAGLGGLITPRISATLLGGYAGDFTNGSIHTFIANAELGYTVSESTRIAIGYSRNALPVPIVGTLIDDRGYLRGGVGFLSNRLTFNGQFSVDYLTFLSAPTNAAAPTPNPTRSDVVLALSVGPNFVVTSWFDIGAGYTLSYRTTQNVTGPALLGLNYLRHEAMLRLDFHY
ncbi:MAG: hypothetical protein DI536_22000 [Archangium gephyra]|uniref:Uncharacterized protein n=1 Tax=Archangium gephyra TaxID=48 RepID=A0A2W5T999_9BACT|nr:MAG: hypothetical protein DI536_22000 [Archangium gephyra]